MATGPQKSRAAYVCNACGAAQPKWSGQCPDCGAWNCLEEVYRPAAPGPRTGGRSGLAAGGHGAVDGARVESLADLKPEERPRIGTGIGELDRVLGGGLVAGSVVLLGGDPGIGKSTLLLQASESLGAAEPVLYVSGEESAQQIGLRARRLGLPGRGIRLLSETCVERVLAQAREERPRVMVVDSIQTLYTDLLQSAPGSVSQVRETAAQLVRFAKLTDTAVFLVGHVTKEGALAGPRVLEHMVDTVLYFEGDSGGSFRLVRAVKNRFGAVNELGVFAMGDRGLREVKNPSAIFLSRHDQPVPGSIVMVTREGTRPLLVEVQALVDESPAGQPPPCGPGTRPEPTLHAARRAASPRRGGHVQPGRLRQRRGRGAYRRDTRQTCRSCSRSSPATGIGPCPWTWQSSGKSGCPARFDPSPMARIASGRRSSTVSTAPSSRPVMSPRKVCRGSRSSPVKTLGAAIEGV